jgi:hypothetical protein
VHIPPPILARHLDPTFPLLGKSLRMVGKLINPLFSLCKINIGGSKSYWAAFSFFSPDCSLPVVVPNV